MQITYETVTAAAARTIDMLTVQAYTSPPEENTLWWERARGAVRMWEETVGAAAHPVDRERLQFMLDDMPGADEEGDCGNRFTPIA